MRRVRDQSRQSASERVARLAELEMADEYIDLRPYGEQVAAAAAAAHNQCLHVQPYVPQPMMLDAESAEPGTHSDDDTTSIGQYVPPPPAPPAAGGAGHAPPIVEDIDDACPLCDECAYHLVMLQRGVATQAADTSSRARAAQVRRIGELRSQLFELERTLALDQPDTVVFATLLRARRLLVEAPLRRFNVDFTPWTLAAIDRHYREHDQDALRAARRAARALEALERDTIVEARKRDADSGAVRVDPKFADVVVRISRQRASIEATIERLVRERRAAGASNLDQRVPALVQALAAVERTSLGATPRHGLALDLGGF